MHIFPRKPKSTPGAYYYGEFDETPLAPFSISSATIDETYQAEAKHYHTSSQKVYLGLHGKAILNVGSEQVEINPTQMIQVEPNEIHFVERVLEAPCTFVVIASAKIDDKVVVQD